MMNTPLTMPVLMDRGPMLYPDNEIVSKMRDKVHRYTYAELGRRARQFANAVTKLGVKQGDRVATMAWNGYRHLEVYYATPCMGAVLHTLNLRLSAADLEYIVNHAEDSVICIDDDLLPILEKLAGKIPTVKHIIVMNNTGNKASDALAATTTIHDYEELIAAESTEFTWPEIDENSPMGLCYTSGTTGHPKGVMYTHRSNYIHTLTGGLPDLLGLKRDDTVMAVVPMFHANAWGLPYICMMLGLKQVFPGPTMDGPSVCQLLQDEKVTFTGGVPTIWMGVINELQANPGKYDLSTLREMVCGGSSPPRAMIDWLEANLGVEFIQAWGMTETSPLGTVCRLKPKMKELPREKKLDVKQRAGIYAPGLKLRIVNDNGEEVAHDGTSMGRLLISGPWIASTYYRTEPTPDKFPDGWLDTGDVATLDTEGYMAIADRSKDLVKSGGEWISSVDLENAIMAVPGVAEAAVIAIVHPKWDERPLACVVKKPGAEVTKEQIYEHLLKSFAKWWMPDDILFIDAVPKTSVGKFDKKVLREQFKDFQLSTGA
ncbi:MAG TPA: long-chain fatty acid--CoA ligase [Blastocatellia bacterium]|nr:long-chain fatty acid--CoA ligase [Blastocatellia bacterium]HMV85333.1 long-chain fatty acid--CoA ligase [Blastocatellia bacterium]HMX29196.1 long-chain fatty acid--CoA ligase [Blastocatellia bacterium]HMZ20091.1 long-chain fatty acid--CoA ligase [Blastocatellia bacterium]HNG29276.1 long-chain fatty acid--CoA ligase [Blastocatellia bacterium]